MQLCSPGKKNMKKSSFTKTAWKRVFLMVAHCLLLYLSIVVVTHHTKVHHTPINIKELVGSLYGRWLYGPIWQVLTSSLCKSSKGLCSHVSATVLYSLHPTILSHIWQALISSTDSPSLCPNAVAAALLCIYQPQANPQLSVVAVSGFVVSSQ